MLPRWKPFIFYASSILVLLLAISFSFSRTNFYKIQHLKSIFRHNPTIIDFLLSFMRGTPNTHKTRPPGSISKPSDCVLWMAPFLSGGGYSSEAWSYILSLDRHIENPRFRLAIEQHGDLESLEFWQGLPQDLKNLAMELYSTECRINETIVICHSEPGAWYPPLFQTVPCPPYGYGGFMSVIGRTMFETDRVSPEHVKRCNWMDYVWVPTDFHVSAFLQSGVVPSKVLKVVQPIDVEFFDPSKHEPLDLSTVSDLVLGADTAPLSSETSVFTFLSVFKWEYRKGWDALLHSYLTEFCNLDGVALYLLTNPYHTDSDFSNKIVKFVKDAGITEPDEGFAPVYVIGSHVAQIDLPRLYKAADAFVLPSRGEGWGRPVVEAMAMALPVIVTNWSGPTEYLTEWNSYPVPVERLSAVEEGPFKGHFWAEPSVETLKGLMRDVARSTGEAEVKGRQARADMVRRFSPKVVAKLVADKIQNILDNRMRIHS